MAREFRRAYSEVITPDKLKEILKKILNAAIAGDYKAAAIIIDHSLGKPRSAPVVDVDILTDLKTPADVMQAANQILECVKNGTITPEDAQRMTSVVDMARKAIETEFLEKRILALEQKE